MRALIRSDLHPGLPADIREAAERYTDAVSDLGKMLIVLGGVVVLVGLGLVLLGKTNLPVGRLPGDIYYRGKNTTFYFPLTTSILLSVVLSLVLYAISRFRR
jgi:H+/Cl- antiporter ClcA